MERPGLNVGHWRKSGQWMVLNRRHATVVATDTDVKDAFKKCEL